MFQLKTSGIVYGTAIPIKVRIDFPGNLKTVVDALKVSIQCLYERQVWL
jgi:hypothetical protein